MKFSTHNNMLILQYFPYGDDKWIQEKFNDNEEIRVGSVFFFNKDNLIEKDEFEEYYFKLGILQNEYYVIDKNILNIKFDLYLDKTLKFNEKLFRLPKGISIFSKIDNILNQQIKIGGNDDESIPIDEFYKLLNEFPTDRELTLYTESRLSNILNNYFSTTTDSQKKLNNYLEKKESFSQISQTNVLKEYEFEKYQFIYDTLKDMLDNTLKYKEKDWQKQILEIILLLYPKYIKAYENVTIKDYYSSPEKVGNRYLDFMLVDTNGYIDIIEIKQPFDKVILNTVKYRDNYTPHKELSGAIVQCEKYLFHLNKWGYNGEKILNSNKKYSTTLPKGLLIKIANPKAIVILGRDKDFTKEQFLDFEIIKRKYSNVIDLLTYDELLRRIDNILYKFK
ncbi:Shedu immune nuclease family protein [Aliarcobacter butzleri]|uniref:Shedu immune nuclease family protein n=1 Tax=Aliarcobacter butzleri TaxID=28197 RepID=UPI00344F0D84